MNKPWNFLRNADVDLQRLIDSKGNDDAVVDFLVQKALSRARRAYRWRIAVLVYFAMRRWSNRVYLLHFKRRWLILWARMKKVAVSEEALQQINRLAEPKTVAQQIAERETNPETSKSNFGFRREKESS